MNPRAQASSAGEQSPVIFRAFQERQVRRQGRWLLLLALPLAGAGIWGLAARTEPPAPLAAFGFRGVRHGMTPQEVGGVLGQPFASGPSRDGRAECLQYSRPTLERASFPVFSLCYEHGRLRDVSVRHFSAQPVGRDGMPAPSAPAQAPPF